MCGLTICTNQTFPASLGSLGVPVHVSMKVWLTPQLSFGILLFPATHSTHISMLFICFQNYLYLHANIQLFLYRTCVLNSEHLKEVPTLPHPGTFFSLHGRGGIKDGSKRELSRVHCPRLSWYFHQKPRGTIRVKPLCFSCSKKRMQKGYLRIFRKKYLRIFRRKYLRMS